MSSSRLPFRLTGFEVVMTKLHDLIQRMWANEWMQTLKSIQLMIRKFSSQKQLFCIWNWNENLIFDGNSFCAHVSVCLSANAYSNGGETENISSTKLNGYVEDALVVRQRVSFNSKRKVFAQLIFKTFSNTLNDCGWLALVQCIFSEIQ